jgi:hypothetical protein
MYFTRIRLFGHAALERRFVSVRCSGKEPCKVGNEFPHERQAAGSWNRSIQRAAQMLRSAPAR